MSQTNQSNCDIARDLMPLSIDGVCSEGSQRFLDAHLVECKPCNDYFDGMKTGMLNIKMEPTQESKSLKKSLRHMGKRYKALWITLIALVCAFALLLMAAGVQQMLWHWITDVPLEMCSTTVGSTSALVYITASMPFLEQDYNGQQFTLDAARAADNHTGQPDAVILTYTLTYFPNRVKDFASSFPDYRYTTSLNGYDLCRDGNKIYLIDGMEGIMTAEGDHVMLLDQGLPVSEIRIKSGKETKTIYTWGDDFNIKPEEIRNDGISFSKIMLRKDYEALLNAQ